MAATGSGREPSLTKSLTILTFVMGVIVVVGLANGMVSQVSLAMPTMDNMMCCATAGKGYLYFPEYNNKTDCMSGRNKGVVLGDSVDQKEGNWMVDVKILKKRFEPGAATYAQAFGGTIVAFVVLVVAWLAKNQRAKEAQNPPNPENPSSCNARTMMCVFCVFGFICGSCTIMLLMGSVLGFLVSSGTITSFFPCRGWTCVKNWDGFQSCVQEQNGSAGIAVFSILWNLLSAVLWFLIATRGCKLYNLYAAPQDVISHGGAVVIQSPDTPVVLSVAQPVQPGAGSTGAPAEVVKAKLVQGAVDGPVIKATIVS